MAAIVTGLIPILRTAVDTTTTYKCRTLWFSFLCVRLVVLFVAEMPWHKLDSDFSCNTTKESICTQACFNQHFNKPVLMAWNFLFVLLILSVLLMELFASHLRSAALKSSRQVKIALETETGGKTIHVADSEPPARMVIDLHKDKSTVVFYLLSTMLRIMVEVWFIWVLLFWNLPGLDEKHFQCESPTCPELHICMVRAVAEKRMSIFALASISAMVVFTSVLFCLYSVYHYLCSC